MPRLAPWQVWVLNVFTRAALQEAADAFKATLGAAPPYKVGVGPFPATWDGWKAYYEARDQILPFFFFSSSRNRHLCSLPRAALNIAARDCCPAARQRQCEAAFCQTPLLAAASVLSHALCCMAPKPDNPCMPLRLPSAAPRLQYVWGNLAGGAFRLPAAAINFLKNNGEVAQRTGQPWG